ncbi:MAG: hypothetical protein HY749_19100 [Gammaproteobacteria bacterium]|nr:hypothetical protein [Gammaproteobacteria bacterium]
MHCCTRLLLLTGALAASTSLYARTFECTTLDEAHWTPPNELRAQLVADGNKAVAVTTREHCYRVVMETADGRRVEGIYNPVGAYPLRRQVR